jgi:RNA polymerase sigma factor (sigma-70 family)
MSIDTTVFETILEGTDPVRVSRELSKARNRIAKGSNRKAAEQSVNDLIGRRKAQALSEDNEELNAHLATVLFLLNEDPYVRRAVKSYRIANEDVIEDIESAARIGLWKAALSFQTSEGTTGFWAWADRGMANEVMPAVAETQLKTLHEWRHTPAVQRAAEELRSHRMAPKVEHISLMTGVSVDAVNRILHPMTTEELDEANPAVDMASPEDLAANYEAAEEASLLTAHIRRLRPQQQAIIQALYVDNLTQKEAAETLGLTVDKVSYHHKAAISSLKKTLTPVF